ncbi:MAG: hypothetical protein WCK98_06680 [bacterium]
MEQLGQPQPGELIKPLYFLLTVVVASILRGSQLTSVATISESLPLVVSPAIVEIIHPNSGQIVFSGANFSTPGSTCVVLPANNRPVPIPYPI